jgi:hypothetical protein
VDSQYVTVYGGATCVKTNGGATQQCLSQYGDVWTYDMTGQRVAQGTVAVSLTAAAAAAPLGPGGVDHLLMLSAGVVQVSRVLSDAVSTAEVANEVFAGFPASGGVVALAIKSGVIVAAGRADVVSDQTVPLVTALVNTSTLRLSLLREDGHSPYEGALATVALYSQAERRNVRQPGAACTTATDGRCQLFSLPTEPPMDYLQGLRAVTDFTGVDATLMFSAAGGAGVAGAGVLCEKRISIGRAPCCEQLFTCVLPTATGDPDAVGTLVVHQLALAPLAGRIPAPGSVGQPSNASGVTTATQVAYLRVSYSADAAGPSQRVQLLVSAPAVSSALTVFASATERFPNPTSAMEPFRGVRSAAGVATTATRADGSGRPGLEAELRVDISATSAAETEGSMGYSGFVYVGVVVAATASVSSPFYVRARIESTLALLLPPPVAVPPPPGAPPRDIATIPGTGIAVPGGPAAVAGILASGGIVLGVALTLLVRSCLKRRERARVEAKLRAQGRLPGGGRGGGTKGGPWRPPMADVEEALGEKFNGSWSPGGAVNAQDVYVESRRAGAGAPLSPEMTSGSGDGGEGPWSGVHQHDPIMGGDGGGGEDRLHPDVVRAYFAAQPGGGAGAETHETPSQPQPPPSRGAYADDVCPFTPNTQARSAEAAERGDVVGYMENVDAMADEYFQSLMGGDAGAGGGQPLGVVKSAAAGDAAWRPMSANTVGRSTEALREKYKRLAGEGPDAAGAGAGGSRGAVEKAPDVFGGMPPRSPPPGVTTPPRAYGAASGAAGAPRAPPGISPPSVAGGGSVRGGGGGNARDGVGDGSADVDVLRMRKHLAAQGLRPATPSSAGFVTTESWDLGSGTAPLGPSSSSSPPLPPPPPLQPRSDGPKPPPPNEEHPDDVARREAAERRRDAAAKRARTVREAAAQAKGGRGAGDEPVDVSSPQTGDGTAAKSILKRTLPEVAL